MNSEHLNYNMRIDAGEIQNISNLINQGLHKEALIKIEDLEKKSPCDKNLEFNKCGFLIDVGCDLRDQALIKKGLDSGEGSLKNPKIGKLKTYIHYNLGNGYYSLYRISESNLSIETIVQSENLQKAKFHFREALNPNNGDCPPDLKKQIYVNLGNCFDTLGRGVEALYLYNFALEIDNTFSMAIGNRAKALCYFADISGKHRNGIYLEAYQEIQSIIDKKDLSEIGGTGIRVTFGNELKRIESFFKDKTVLAKKLKHSAYRSKKLSYFEKFFLDFCIKNKLFLNFHIHQDHCEAAITDPIFISIITKIEDKDTFYNLAKYINQIKEDYAIARLLLVQSRYKRKDFDNISKRTTFVNTLDYSQFNLYYGLLKASFRETYNILDKIAFFINAYCYLELPEKAIYFTTIWRKGNKIRDEILKSKNISLYALYDIYQDFKSGRYKEIQDIRNALTHRKLVIFDSTFGARSKKDGGFNIGYDAMLNSTIEIMQLTKSAIIYLINFVNSEENKKRKKELIVPMHVDTSQFL